MADHKPVKDIKSKWALVTEFVAVRGLVRQHVDSFNHFVNVDLKNILKANEKVTCQSDPSFYLKYIDISIGVPSIEDNLVKRSTTPQECRLRDLTYSAPIIVDVEYTRGRELVRRRGITIGKLPIMLKSSNCVLSMRSDNDREKSDFTLPNGLPPEEKDSEYQRCIKLGECPLDPGGYFVVKGVEKVILSQEQIAKNRIIIETDTNGNYCASVTSASYTTKSRTIIYFKRDRFLLKHNTFTEDIPLMVIVKAMGLESDYEFVSLVGADVNSGVRLSLSIEDSFNLGIFTQQQALTYISSRSKVLKNTKLEKKTKNEEILNLLGTIVLSHIYVSDYNFRPKLMYIATMVRWIIRSMKTKVLDDKDYYGNKRLELAGSLMGLLFEDLFKKFNSDLSISVSNVLSKQNRAAQFDILNCMHPSTLTNGLAYAISTGHWSLKRFKMERAGITQVLTRHSYIAALGMMTRITSQFEKTRKISGPRALQPSQWGVLCPSDTPEGESCGLVKNLALLAYVTTDSVVSSTAIENIAFALGVSDITLAIGNELYDRDNHLVFLDGRLIGIHSNPKRFLNDFKALRRTGKLSETISVHINTTQCAVHIATDGGRICRPLIIVKNGIPMVTQRHIDLLVGKFITFDDFVQEGLIEFIDVNEENDSSIALKESDITNGTTHLEIDPFSILGVVAGLIPFPHHNQSPRNTYQCAMGKQAMGNIAFNQAQRIDTILYLLVYPQKPLVKTKTMDIIKFDQLCAGHNSMVAVMSYSGYDIEDAIVLNKASLDRGFGRCTVVRKALGYLKKYSNGAADRLASAPPQTNDHIRAHGQTHDSFHAIGMDGLSAPGDIIEPGDVYMNKQIPINTTDPIASVDQMADNAFVDSPQTYKGPSKITIDKVLLTSNDEENFFVKFLFRSTRRPELGDKFSSRHGQKGVTGLIVTQCDMPFTEQGICPDLIMNPHGFPSRMTVGKMIELISGKAAVIEGRFGDGTAFGGDKVDDIGKSLVRNGYSFGGKEILYSGITGKPLSAYVFFGPVYYQKLKHMVLDKMHARARGPQAVLTRQPTEGRSRDGGLRLGEMERDCLIGHGASAMLQERLMHSSDEFTVHVCRQCGQIMQAKWCTLCATGAHVCALQMPYACKLLFQELQAMNIVPRVTLKEV